VRADGIFLDGIRDRGRRSQVSFPRTVQRTARLPFSPYVSAMAITGPSTMSEYFASNSLSGGLRYLRFCAKFPQTRTGKGAGKTYGTPHHWRNGENHVGRPSEVSTPAANREPRPLSASLARQQPHDNDGFRATVPSGWSLCARPRVRGTGSSRLCLPRGDEWFALSRGFPSIYLALKMTNSGFPVPHLGRQISAQMPVLGPRIPILAPELLHKFFPFLLCSHLL